MPPHFYISFYPPSPFFTRISKSISSVYELVSCYVYILFGERRNSAIRKNRQFRRCLNPQVEASIVHCLILSPRNLPRKFLRAFINERGLYLRWKENAETSDAVRHTPSWLDTLPYGLPTVRTLVQRAVARTVSPQLSWLWLLLRHPPILSLSLSRSLTYSSTLSIVGATIK